MKPTILSGAQAGTGQTYQDPRDRIAARGRPTKPAPQAKPKPKKRETYIIDIEDGGSKYEVEWTGEAPPDKQAIQNLIGRTRQAEGRVEGQYQDKGATAPVPQSNAPKPAPDKPMRLSAKPNLIDILSYGVQAIKEGFGEQVRGDMETVAELDKTIGKPLADGRKFVGDVAGTIVDPYMKAKPADEFSPGRAVSKGIQSLDPTQMLSAAKPALDAKGDGKGGQPLVNSIMGWIANPVPGTVKFLSGVDDATVQKAIAGDVGAMESLVGGAFTFASNFVGAKTVKDVFASGNPKKIRNVLDKASKVATKYGDESVNGLGSIKTAKPVKGAQLPAKAKGMGWREPSDVDPIVSFIRGESPSVTSVTGDMPATRANAPDVPANPQNVGTSPVVDYKALAIEHLGTTRDFREAGYVLDDGQMLDFSGKRQGGQSGVRYMDHRELPSELGLGAGSATERMQRFQKETGALRVSITGQRGENLAAEFTKPLTPAQMRWLEIHGEGNTVTIEATNPTTGYPLKSYEYDGASKKQIAGAMRRLNAALQEFDPKPANTPNVTPTPPDPPNLTVVDNTPGPSQTAGGSQLGGSVLSKADRHRIHSSSDEELMRVHQQVKGNPEYSEAQSLIETRLRSSNREGTADWVRTNLDGVPPNMPLEEQLRLSIEGALAKKREPVMGGARLTREEIAQKHIPEIDYIGIKLAEAYDKIANAGTTNNAKAYTPKARVLESEVKEYLEKIGNADEALILWQEYTNATNRLASAESRHTFGARSKIADRMWDRVERLRRDDKTTIDANPRAGATRNSDIRIVSPPNMPNERVGGVGDGNPYATGTPAQRAAADIPDASRLDRGTSAQGVGNSESATTRTPQESQSVASARSASIKRDLTAILPKDSTITRTIDTETGKVIVDVERKVGAKGDLLRTRLVVAPDGKVTGKTKHWYKRASMRSWIDVHHKNPEWVTDLEQKGYAPADPLAPDAMTAAKDPDFYTEGGGGGVGGTTPPTAQGGGGGAGDTPKRPMTAMDYAKEASYIARGLKLGADVGALLRQGGEMLINDPIQWARSTKNAFTKTDKAKLTKYYSEMEARTIHGKNMADVRKAAGLKTSHMDTEEAFASKMFDKVPGLNRLENFQKAFLDSGRIERFDSFYRKFPDATDKELRDYAKYLNSAMGKSNVSRVPEALEVVMTSPRWTASRWEMAGRLMRTPEKWVRGALGNKAAKQEARNLGRYAVAMYGMLKVAESQGAQIEFDPRSSDFLKMRMGEKVFDPTSGVAMPIRTALRMMLYARGEDAGFGSSAGIELAKTAINTANPVITTPWGLITGKNLTGFELDEEERGAMLMLPLIANGAMESWKKDGPIGAMIQTGTEIVGINSLRYPKKKPEWKPRSQAKGDTPMDTDRLRTGTKVQQLMDKIPL